MFDLNPLHQPNAWWQHLIMLLGAGILGYIIGYRKSRGLVVQLEEELQVTSSNLTECQKSLSIESENSRASLAGLSAMGSTSASKPSDNLKKIEGIGPKIETLLNQSGIYTFRQLSNTSAEHVRTILQAGGSQFDMHDPSSWPQQAALAADGKWDELNSLQNELYKGRAL